MPLLLIFIIIPMIELAVLIKVGSYIGVLWTVALIFLTAVVGVSLLRVQGLTMLMRASRKMEEGTLPAKELAEGFLLALAGALLLTPGFVTDAVGFALLIPAVRGMLLGSVMKMLQVRTMGNVSGAFHAERDVHTTRTHEIHSNTNETTVIDGEYRRED